ncbi:MULTISPECIES: NAD(P)/FAD-dependent oxidoreductase [unclassified Salegentibacter]|jgi:flavin-dependent dehydrogenase|uniref:NAD(P)/FAD-dependent oxidoreductase n=1 Tax=unclassified Salegentibacter TaxID=2633436 RepID=UPI00094A3F82|nr:MULTISPECIES: NAD(P)/FAD-dependent oxidoreductase [unclassified Salegentibacter]APS39675.1 pyridine nucleotide-disulfide oxidoreductase [Salegentibacter sp. T436]
MKKLETQILIIGAGPSGMVAAGYLKKHGVNCLVVEKSSFPRFSIGESLLPKSMENFEEAGLLDAIMAAGFQKKYGARFIKNGKVGEFDFSEKYGNGWDWTWQVPRADFDLVLANEIQRQGVEIFFGAEVSKVNFYGKKSTTEILINFEENIEINADFIIDASGNGRVLANQLDLNTSPKITGNSSIFTHIKETNRPKGKEGELITFEVLDTKTWFWYFPFSNGNSSLGFVSEDEWFKGFSSDNSVAFREMLKELKYYRGRFDEELFLFNPIKIPSISRNVKKMYGNGFALCGNSAEFLDPIFSSGVAFATESGLQAATLAKLEVEGKDVNWEKDYAEYMQNGISVFSNYVKEWYTGNLQKLFFHEMPKTEIKEQICAVLAGYVWDKSNPFVKNHQRIIKNVARLIDQEEINV